MDGFWRVESSQTPARGPQFEPNVQGPKATKEFLLLSSFSGSSFYSLLVLGFPLNDQASYQRILPFYHMTSAIESTKSQQQKH
jgi:hypothetical protein